MRKHTATLLSLILVLTLACSATLAFTSVTSSTTSTTAVAANITPENSYMQLTTPKHVAHSDSTLIVANDKKLFIDQGAGIYIEIFAADSKETILQIAANAIHIAILSQSEGKDSTNLYIYNSSDGKLLKTYDTTVFPLEPSLITADSNGIYVLDSSNSLYLITDINNDVPTTPIMKGINTQFSSKMAAHNKSVYLYRRKTTSSDLTIYQYTDGVEKALVTDETITSFAVVDDGIYYVSNNMLNYKSSVSDSAYAPIQINQTTATISAVGNNIYIATPSDNRVVTATRDSTANTLTITGYYGDKGSELGRLSSPSGISVMNEQVLIADYDNKRIIATDPITKARKILLAELDHSPSLIASSGTFFATIDSELVLRQYECKNNTVRMISKADLSTYSSVSDIEVTATGTVYALVGASNVIKVTGTDILALDAVPNIKAISLSRDNYLYMAATDKLIRYNLNAELAENTFPIISNTIDDFFIDFAGNAYYLSSNVLSRYTRLNMTYTLAERITVSGVSTDVKIAYDRTTGNCYIADKQAHKLLALSAIQLSTMSEINMNYTHPSSELWTVVTAGAVINSGYLLSAPNNDEAITKVNSGSIFLALAEVTYSETKYYYGVLADNDNEHFYIMVDNLELYDYISYPSSHEAMSPMYSSGAKLYSHPYHSATVLSTANKGDRLELIDNVAYHSGTHIWKWYKVRYIDSNGSTIIAYAHSSDIYYSGISTPPKNKKYLKVNSAEFGVPVSMYAEPSDQSDVLVSDISDGSRVMLAQDSFLSSNEYTRVTYNNLTGYIKTTHLKESGLTESQRMALIISTASLGVLLVIILLIVLRKKVKPNGKNHDGLSDFDHGYNNNN